MNYCVGGPTGGGTIPADGDVYSVGISVVAYVCNFSSLGNTCYQDEVAASIQHSISSTCGTFKSGYDVVIDRAVQYGYDVFTASFCNRGIEWK